MQLLRSRAGLGTSSSTASNKKALKREAEREERALLELATAPRESGKDKDKGSSDGAGATKQKHINFFEDLEQVRLFLSIFYSMIFSSSWFI